MEKFEKLDNEKKELVSYWIEKYKEHCVDAFRVKDNRDFIEKHLTPEPVIEVGKVYILGDCFMIFANSFNRCKATIIGYGFDFSGNWKNEMSYKISSSDSIKQATPEEYEPRLFEEAKRMGYKEGVKVRCLISGDVSTIKATYFLSEINELFVHKSGNEYLGECIMSNGKWAKIIDDKAELRDTIARIKTELSTLEAQL